MIAKLKGNVDTVSLHHVVVDVQGVGYLVSVSSKTLAALPPLHSPVTLLIQTIYRSESLDLYGFLTESERELFNLLLTVQGVGARVALALQSALSPDDIASAITHQDKTMLTRADGVGPKLASRILMELKDKVTGSLSATPSFEARTPLHVAGLEDTISVLVRLGYRRPDAEQAAQKAAKGEDGSSLPSVEEMVKTALRLLAKGSM